VLRQELFTFRREGQRLLTERFVASPQTLEARNLKEHLEELKVLYAEIPKHVQSGIPKFLGVGFVQYIANINTFFDGEVKVNPHYPMEDYQARVGWVERSETHQ
jgi:hypothetical protein